MFVITVLAWPGQANEPADRTEFLGATAEVHGEVLHPRPEPAGGGVHQVPLLPPDQEGPRHRQAPVQRQHLGPDGVIHCTGWVSVGQGNSLGMTTIYLDNSIFSCSAPWMFLLRSKHLRLRPSPAGIIWIVSISPRIWNNSPIYWDWQEVWRN